MFQSSFISSFVSISIWPSEDTLSWHISLFPFSFILTLIWKFKTALTIKKVFDKVSLINSRIRCIVPISFFHSFNKTSLIQTTIPKCLTTISMRFIILPLPLVLIVMRWVPKTSLSTGFVSSNLPFVNTTVSENKSAIAFSYSIAKTSLIVRTILIKKFTSTMTFLIKPLSMIESWRCLKFIVGLK